MVMQQHKNNTIHSFPGFVLMRFLIFIAVVFDWLKRFHPHSRAVLSTAWLLQ